MFAFLEFIEKADQRLLVFLNNQRLPWLDDIMFNATDKLFWIPLYLLFIYLIYKKHGLKNTLLILLSVALLITLCDRISVVAFKDVVKRLRPCHNTDIQHQLFLVRDYCAGKYSFVSSHATNYFGLAALLTFVLQARGIYAFALFFWAAFIAYTRIYLGVHYPLDIIGGAILGISIAYGVIFLLKKFVLKPNIQ